MSPERDTRSLAPLELVGGAPCLDFANTLNSRTHPDRDELASYGKLLAWAERAGLLDRERALRLAQLAGRRPDEAGAALLAAVELREAIYRVFSALAAGTTPEERDLAALRDAHAAAVAAARLEPDGPRYALRWTDADDLAAVRWEIARSAVELLTSPDAARVKECGGCGWLFLDASKNRSRRWCSMSACGARDKMRRHRQRTRQNATDLDGSEVA